MYLGFSGARAGPEAQLVLDVLGSSSHFRTRYKRTAQNRRGGRRSDAGHVSSTDDTVVYLALLISEDAATPFRDNYEQTEPFFGYW